MSEGAPTNDVPKEVLQESSNSTEVPSEKMADMKLENGVPAGDTGVTPTPAPVTPQPTTPAPSEGAESPQPGNFKQIFKAFSKFGDTKSDGRLITLSQSDKWMKQAKVIDGKKITTTDTGIYFKKLKSMKVNFDDYHKFLEDLAKNKKVDIQEMKTKMANCGAPGLHGVPTGKSAAAVDRLTDVTKYTGSHKQRFDQTGKGKGIAGRKDIQDTSGYVSGYINKNTYDKTH